MQRYGRSLRRTQPTKRTLTQRAIAVLRKYGSAATLYLPGVGTVNGLTAGNYIDSLGTTPCAYDSPLGYATDSFGGRHATQATAASKPTLRRGLVNQLSRSGEFVTNDQWTISGLSSTTVTGPDGSSSATMLTVTNASSALAVSQIKPVVATSTEATVAYVLKATGDANTRPLLLRNGTTATNFQVGVFNQVTGAITGVGWASTAMGSDWYLVTFTQSSGISVGNTLLLYAGFTGGPQVMSTTLVVHRAALFQGTVTAQQIIAAGGIPVTTTAPASSTAGKPWWEFDGSNDFLQTGITTGNEGWICAGVTPNSATSNHTIAGNGAGAGSLKGVWLASANGGLSYQLSVSDGSGLRDIANCVQTPSNVPKVIDGGWGGSDVFVASNGVAVTVPKTMNPTHTAGLQIGGLYSYFHNGSMSAALYFSVLPSAADRAILRKWVGSLQGQTL